MSRTRLLDEREQRVVGALMEKEQATPDHYPLTLKALVAACNQKSNRDPVTSYGEEEVREALETLRRDVLVWRAEGPRAEKWEQRVDTRWRLDGESKAIMTLLLLRGPQTLGELRSRSERLHYFPDVRAVEAKLREMAVEEDPLVVELSREPGQRESRWQHLVGELGDGHRRGEEGPSSTVASVAPRPGGDRGAGGVSERLETLEKRMDELERRLAELRERVD